MDAVTLLQHDLYANVKARATERHSLEGMQVLGAVIGLCGGVMVSVAGSLLTAAGWLAVDAAAKHWLSTTGTRQLLLTVPLIALGAYCLDWIEKDKPKRRSKPVRHSNDDGDDDDGQ